MLQVDSLLSEPPAKTILLGFNRLYAHFLLTSVPHALCFACWICFQYYLCTTLSIDHNKNNLGNLFLQTWRFKIKLFIERVSYLVMSDSLNPPWTVALQAPLAMGFSRQEYWSALSFTSPRDLPESEIKRRSPA